MLGTATSQPAPKAAVWAGRTMSRIVILFLIDFTMKLANLTLVTQAGLQMFESS
jgi:hypothetical protein